MLAGERYEELNAPVRPVLQPGKGRCGAADEVGEVSQRRSSKHVPEAPLSPAAFSFMSAQRQARRHGAHASTPRDSSVGLNTVRRSYRAGGHSADSTPTNPRSVRRYCRRRYRHRRNTQNIRLISPSRRPLSRRHDRVISCRLRRNARVYEITR